MDVDSNYLVKLNKQESNPVLHTKMIELFKKPLNNSNLANK